MSSTIQINPIALALLQQINPQTQTKERTKPHHTPADPIRDDAQILKAKEWFLNQPQRYQGNNLNLRNYLLFTIGINLGRRFSDTRNMRFSDFLYPDNTFRDHLEIVEQKTGKLARVYINDAVRQALSMYIEQVPHKYNDYLFVSRNKNDADPRLSNKQVNRIYQQMAKEVGIQGHISTHSTRKTMAHRMIKSNPNDIRTLINVQKTLNHRDFSTTLRYAGIQQEEIDNLHQSISI